MINRRQSFRDHLLAVCRCPTNTHQHILNLPDDTSDQVLIKRACEDLLEAMTDWNIGSTGTLAPAIFKMVVTAFTALDLEFYISENYGLPARMGPYGGSMCGVTMSDQDRALWPRVCPLESCPMGRMVACGTGIQCPQCRVVWHDVCNGHEGQLMGWVCPPCEIKAIVGAKAEDRLRRNREAQRAAEEKARVAKEKAEQREEARKRSDQKAADRKEAADQKEAMEAAQKKAAADRKEATQKKSATDLKKVREPLDSSDDEAAAESRPPADSSDDEGLQVIYLLVPLSFPLLIYLVS